MQLWSAAARVVGLPLMQRASQRKLVRLHVCLCMLWRRGGLLQHSSSQLLLRCWRQGPRGFRFSRCGAAGDWPDWSARLLLAGLGDGGTYGVVSRRGSSGRLLQPCAVELPGCATAANAHCVYRLLDGHAFQLSLVRSTATVRLQQLHLRPW